MRLLEVVIGEQGTDRKKGIGIMVKKFIFYLFVIIIILVPIYVLLDSSNDTKSTMAYIVAMFSFFFGPGAFFKLKDWWFSKGPAKLIINNTITSYPYEIKNEILQSYSIDICILNVGEMTVIKKVCLDTDEGVFRMLWKGGGEINTDEQRQFRCNVNPARRLKINQIFVEDFDGHKWFMDKTKLQKLTHSFEDLLKNLEMNRYVLPKDF